VPLVTNTDVFDFCRTADDIQSTEGSQVTDLIARVINEIEGQLGRKIQATSFSNVLFQDGLNCRINENKLWLHGIYRDIYSITSIYEDGVLLTAATDYGQDSDYYLNQNTGCLLNQNGSWSSSNLGIKMTGSLGIGGASGAADLKQLVIEMVAVRAKLWTVQYIDDSGTVESIKSTVPKSTMEVLNRYRLLDIC
jgi:hypothetical protein